ncbi:MAG: hypothetical protein JSU04_17445 [Bdellovibrionales bacterium]|nr:hypothetical protein [Bdellovibrionales bacterium]
MKKLLIALLASSLFFNTACTDDEVAAGVIGAAIGVGIAVGAGGGHHDHDHDRRPPDRYPGPDYGRPGYGRPGYGRGPGYGPGPGRPHRGYSADVTLASSEVFDTAVGANSQTVDFASKYGISDAAAAKIETAFANVETQGLASFESIGLKKADLKDIAKREMPDTDSLKAVAGKLDMSQAQARDLIKELIQNFDAQASNVDSNYWQSCMAKGRWKTPQNMYCKSTSWNGCAPATGASLCY